MSFNDIFSEQEYKQSTKVSWNLFDRLKKENSFCLKDWGRAAETYSWRRLRRDETIISDSNQRLAFTEMGSNIAFLRAGWSTARRIVSYYDFNCLDIFAVGQNSEGTRCHAVAAADYLCRFHFSASFLGRFTFKSSK